MTGPRHITNTSDPRPKAKPKARKKANKAVTKRVIEEAVTKRIVELRESCPPSTRPSCSCSAKA
jgi:hypothetical protein